MIWLPGPHGCAVGYKIAPASRAYYRRRPQVSARAFAPLGERVAAGVFISRGETGEGVKTFAFGTC